MTQSIGEPGRSSGAGGEPPTLFARAVRPARLARCRVFPLDGPLFRSGAVYRIAPFTCSPSSPTMVGHSRRAFRISGVPPRGTVALLLRSNLIVPVARLAPIYRGSSLRCLHPATQVAVHLFIRCHRFGCRRGRLSVTMLCCISPSLAGQGLEWPISGGGAPDDLFSLLAVVLSLH